jgi:integrase
LRRKPSVWLFPGNRWHTGDIPITTKVVWDACKKAAQRAGLQKEVHPHTLRHYVEFRTMPSRSKNYRSIRPLTAFGLGIIRTA